MDAEQRTEPPVRRDLGARQGIFVSKESTEEIERRIQEREKARQGLLKENERLQMAKKIERKQRFTETARFSAIAVVAVLLLAGAGYGYTSLSSSLDEKSCKFHDHATFRVVDEDEVLRFVHPRFDMDRMAMRAHLHQRDDATLHLEGGCANVQEVFGLMGMKIKPGYLKLDQELHDEKELVDEGNRTLRFFLYHEVDDQMVWEEDPRLLGHQLRDGQRLLVIYGNHTDEEITQYQAMVPQPPGA